MFNREKEDKKGVEVHPSASKWLSLLEDKYKEQVEHAKSNVIVVLSNTSHPFEDYGYSNESKHLVFCEDVIKCVKAAVTRNEGKRVCVLNFASPSHPGGGFLKGATAQEECICRASGLYPCLSQDICKSWYRYKKGASELQNSYIYTRDCPFIVNGSVYLADVLTMAAPCIRDKYQNYSGLLKECQRTAFRIPAMYSASVILLGAWGCGVFGNDP